VTGPQHYAEAERHTRAAVEDFVTGQDQRAQTRVGLAQVHATLALTAAVAELDDYGGSVTGRTEMRGTEWSRAFAGLPAVGAS
jgi:hypothetical protein